MFQAILRSRLFILEFFIPIDETGGEILEGIFPFVRFLLRICRMCWASLGHSQQIDAMELFITFIERIILIRFVPKERRRKKPRIINDRQSNSHLQLASVRFSLSISVCWTFGLEALSYKKKLPKTCHEEISGKEKAKRLRARLGVHEENNKTTGGRSIFFAPSQ